MNPLRPRFLIVWLFLFVIIFLIEMPYLQIPFSENEGMFSCVAQQMRLGAKLYQDVWDHKPPLLFLHYVWLQDLFGTSELPLRLYTSLFHCFDAFLVFVLVRRFGFEKKAAWMTASSYVFLLLPPFFQAWTPQAEVLMQPFLISSFCLALAGKEWASGLSGVIWAISFFTKPTTLFFTPLYFLLARKEKLKAALFFILGADSVALAVVLPFLLDGRFSLMGYALWGFNKTYVAWGWKVFFNNPIYLETALQWHGKMLLGYGLPIFALFLFTSKKMADEKEYPKFYLFVFGWFFISLLSCVVSGFFHPYYYFMLVPPLALGLGIGISKAWLEKRVLYFVFIVLMVIGLLAPWFRVVSQGMDGIVDSDYSRDRARESKIMGLYLKGMANPSERLFVWSTEPQIYVYSGLKMADLRTPLVNHLVELTQDWEDLESSFATRPPDYVVISEFDQLIPPPLWLLDELSKHYRRSGSQGHYDLYLFNKKETVNRQKLL